MILLSQNTLLAIGNVDLGWTSTAQRQGSSQQVGRLFVPLCAKMEPPLMGTFFSDGKCTVKLSGNVLLTWVALLF